MTSRKISWQDMLSSFEPVGTHVTNTDISTAAVLTPATGATKLLIQTVGADIRYTLDGTVPTVASGFQLKADDTPIMIAVGFGVIVTVIEEGTAAVLEYQWGN